jgi:ABC-type phosphate/phosphonate transport system substrate-binding protein
MIDVRSNRSIRESTRSEPTTTMDVIKKRPKLEPRSSNLESRQSKLDSPCSPCLRDEIRFDSNSISPRRHGEHGEEIDPSDFCKRLSRFEIWWRLACVGVGLCLASSLVAAKKMTPATPGGAVAPSAIRLTPVVTGASATPAIAGHAAVSAASATPGPSAAPVASGPSAVSVASVASVLSVPSSRRALAIGFLPEGSDFGNAAAVMERLRRDLLGRASVLAALAEAGFAPEIELSPCDGPRDMAQRMNQNEFDLAFPTAVVDALQQGDYGEPILMTWRPGDLKRPRDAGVLRRGVVFAGRAAKGLLGPDAPKPGVVREALANAPLAVPSADSAAGYIYPLLKMMQDGSRGGAGKCRFCGSDAETVKNVVAGLAPLGACREGELEALLPGAGDSGRYYRVLFRTDPFPTDPIVLRSALAPDRSALGRELKVALRMFFQQDGAAQGDALSVENAGERSYEKLRRDLRLFEQVARRSAATRLTPSATGAPGAPGSPVAAGPSAVSVPSVLSVPSPARAVLPARPVLPGLPHAVAEEGRP